jgi:hypothetical protein
MNPEIGVIQREQIQADRAPGTVVATEAFTAAVAERYTPRAVTVSCADLALAWEPPAEINYFHNSPRIEISPTVNIEDRYVFAAASKDLSGTPAAPAGSREAAASALFERVFSRQIRVTAFEPPPRADRLREPGRRAFETPPRPDGVERIVHHATAGEKPFASPMSAEPARSVPAAVRETDWEASTPASSPAAREVAWGTAAPASSSSAGEVGWGSPFAFKESLKPVTLAAPEIKRVAEQVMREIDRRVVARRERMGRR